MIAGGHAAWRQQHAVIKPLAYNVLPEAFLKRSIALALVEFVLIVVEQRVDAFTFAELPDAGERGGKIRHLPDVKRYATLGKRGP